MVVHQSMDVWEKNGFSVKVLFSRPGVATQILVAVEDSLFLVDAGDGVLRDLLRIEAELYEGVDAIFITHEHYDHVGGLFSLLNYLHIIGRKKPISIVVPEPNIIARAFVELQREYARRFRGFEVSFPIEVTDISDQEEKFFDPLAVKAFSVLHSGGTRPHPMGKMSPAVGYVLGYRDIRVVFSGDTAACDSLRQEVKGADLAVLDATYRGRPVVPEKHMSVEEAEEIGRQAKEYMLIHRLP